MNNVQEVCEALKRNAQACQLCVKFQAFFEQLQSRFKIDRYTLAMELSGQVSLQQGYPSVHLHAMFDSRRCLVIERQALVFENMCAYISTDAPRARGRAAKAAWDQGHYYLQCPKEGQIFVKSDELLFLQSVGAWHKDGTDVQQMDRRLGCLVC